MLVLLPYQASAYVITGNNNKDSNDEKCSKGMCINRRRCYDDDGRINQKQYQTKMKSLLL